MFARNETMKKLKEEQRISRRNSKETQRHSKPKEINQEHKTYDKEEFWNTLIWSCSCM